MKSRKISFALLAAAVSILLSVTAWAASPAFMWVVGQNQGPIDGSSNVQGREGAIIVEALTHSIDVPFDPQTGQPSGIYNTYRIPFGESVRVTAQLCEGDTKNKRFWYIFRGVENLPVVLSGLQ